MAPKISLIDSLWEALALPPLPLLPPAPLLPRLPPTSSHSSSRGGVTLVTICPTFVFGRTDPLPSAFRHRKTRVSLSASTAEMSHVFGSRTSRPRSSRKVLTGLPLTPATSPAPVRRQLVDFIAQVIANRCMPGPRGPCVRSWVVSYVAFGVCVCVCVCVIF